MNRLIFAVLSFFCAMSASAQTTIDRLKPETIRSADGRKTWTVYHDTVEADVFYTLPELARIKKEKKGSGLTILVNDDGSLTGTFQWTPIDVLEDSLSLDRSLRQKYGANVRLIPATPNSIDINWMDFEGFGAEFQIGTEPSVVAGNIEPVEFTIPADMAEGFSEKVVSEKCRATGNCGVFMLLEYRFILPSANDRIGSFTHSLAAFIDSAPYCKVFTYEPKCIASNRN